MLVISLLYQSEMPREGKDKLPHSLVQVHTMTMYGRVEAQLPYLT